MTRDVQLIRAVRACTKFSMRCDGAGMNIFRRRTPARAASLLPDFQSNFYFTGQHSPAIKIRARAPPVSTKFSTYNNNSFNVRILLTCDR